jgi:hypothetical protein
MAANEITYPVPMSKLTHFYVTSGVRASVIVYELRLDEPLQKERLSQVFNHFRRNDDYNKSQTASLQSGFFSLTMVPEAGLEPAWIMHPRDFESIVSANCHLTLD